VIGGKKIYIDIFGSFTEPFNCQQIFFVFFAVQLILVPVLYGTDVVVSCHCTGNDLNRKQLHGEHGVNGVIKISRVIKILSTSFVEIFMVDDIREKVEQLNGLHCALAMLLLMSMSVSVVYLYRAEYCAECAN